MTETAVARQARMVGPAPGPRVHGLGPAALMAAGLGWAGGAFTWPGPEWTDQTAVAAVHAAPIGLVVLAVAGIASGVRVGPGRLVLTGLACAIKAMTVFVVVWGLVHPDGFGPHGLAGWIPVGIANAGGGLWLKTVLRDRLRDRRGTGSGERRR